MNIKELLTNCGVELTAEQETKLNAEFPKQFKPAEVYNADVQKHKAAAETYKAQLDEANKQIDQFKGLNVEEIQKAADDWKAKYEAADADYQKKISDRDYEDTARAALANVKFTSKSAERAFLASLKASPLPVKDGKLLGFDDVLKQAQTDDPSAFATDKPTPTFTVPGGTGNPAEITKEVFQKMGYMDKLKLKTEQPEIFKGLVQK